MMMEKQQLAVRQCDMEVMKMAMLRQEQTFRHQVHELHRLYRIQRQLMTDLGSRGGGSELLQHQQASTARRRPRRVNKHPRRSLNLQLPADEYIVSTDEDDEEEERRNNAAAADEEAELLELTLALGGGGGRSTRRSRRQKGRNNNNNNSSGGGGGSNSPCGSLLSSSSAEYYSDDGPAAVAVQHAPPCQRAMAFDLAGAEGAAMMVRQQQQAPWLVQCQQYLSLRMT